MTTTFPIVIVAASVEGLHIRQDDKPRLLGWHEIAMIVVGTAMDGDTRIFRMALEIEEERIFIAFEAQAIWRELIEVLPIGLPDKIPYEFWSMGLNAVPSIPITIYERRPLAVCRAARPS